MKRTKILPPTSTKCFAAKPERGARKQELFCKYNNLFLLELLHSTYRLHSTFTRSWQQELFPQTF